MVELILEQPVAADKELADDTACFHRGIGLGRELAFASLDVGREPVAQLAVKGTNQGLDAVVAIFRGVAAFLAAEGRNGATQAESLQDPLEALAGMHAFIEGNLYERLDIFFLAGL